MYNIYYKYTVKKEQPLIEYSFKNRVKNLYSFLLKTIRIIYWNICLISVTDLCSLPCKFPHLSFFRLI